MPLSFGDLFLIAVLGLWLGWAIFAMIRRRRAGKCCCGASCGGGCSGCAGGCTERRTHGTSES